MMKKNGKIVSAALSAVLLAISLFACGGGGAEKKNVYGYVMNIYNEPISNALVECGGKSARTRMSGYFELAPDGDIDVVTVSADGYFGQTAAYRGNRSVNFNLFDKRTVSGTVTDFISERGLSGATVYASADKSISAVSGDDGAYTLSFRFDPRGDKTVIFFEADGYVKHTASVSGGAYTGGAARLDAGLLTATVFSGTVLLSDGSPASGAKVSIRPKITENGDRPSVISDTRIPEVFTDENGAFSVGEDFYIYQSDEYTLSISLPGYSTFRTVLQESDAVYGRVFSEIDVVLAQ